MDKKITCLFCGSDNTKESFYPKVLFNDKVFVYRECQICKLNFNYPLLTDDDYKALYPVGYHDEFYFKTGKKFNKQLAILRKYSGIKSFTDYGCGDASLLNFLSQNGFYCTGVEFNADLVSRLKAQYPSIKFYTVEEFDKLEEKYDCIHLGDVLEHMTDPNRIIQKLTNRVEADGYLFIEGPLEHNVSIAFWFRRTMMSIRKKINPGRQVAGKPFHTFLANKTNQQRMLEKNKLTANYFKVYETAWPFPERLKDCRGIKSFVEYIVGRFSIFVSYFFANAGNRFYYLGKKKEEKI